MRTLICLLLVLIYGNAIAQVPSSGNARGKRILIRYATVHVGNGEKIDNAYVEIASGEISRVAEVSSSRINESDYDTIINADGKHIYPGFIIMDSRLGLTEIGAVKATHDYQETGEFLPNVRALPAFNTESKIISTVRTNGVLMAQVAPKGNRISGSSSAVHFDGWTWEGAVIAADEGIYLNWPERFSQTGWWAQPGKSKPNKKYASHVDEIKTYFKEAQAYSELKNPTTKNLRFEAMNRLFDGSSRLYIRVESARDILDVVQFKRTFNIEKIALVGASESFLVTTELKENNIPVIIDRVHKLPIHIDSPINEPFTLASELNKSGIQIAFATSGDMEAMISRNLPFQVGTAVYHGLSYEEAIKALTLSPAELMDIATDYGSIEPGKNATLFISDGDALDIPTNKVTLAFIQGKIIDLTNHQTALNQTFARKHGVSP